MERYLEHLNLKAQPQAIAVAKELIEKHSGPFEPETMPETITVTPCANLCSELERQKPKIVLKLVRQGFSGRQHYEGAEGKACQAKGQQIGHACTDAETR